MSTTVIMMGGRPDQSNLFSMKRINKTVDGTNEYELDIFYCIGAVPFLSELSQTNKITSPRIPMQFVNRTDMDHEVYTLMCYAQAILDDTPSMSTKQMAKGYSSSQGHSLHSTDLFHTMGSPKVKTLFQSYHVTNFIKDIAQFLGYKDIDKQRINNFVQRIKMEHQNNNYSYRDDLFYFLRDKYDLLAQEQEPMHLNAPDLNRGDRSCLHDQARDLFGIIGGNLLTSEIVNNNQIAKNTFYILTGKIEISGTPARADYKD